ncbi:50S ribosomal protein L9 [Candidatus Dojkabacteria bacterium]|nr:50S ribosomal protein L9 [Candidatus Dojkabacteria bacterium]
MKVVLIEDCKGIGKKGDIVEIKSGYAVNFLIPRKIAAVASDNVLAQAKKTAKQEEEQSLVAADEVIKIAQSVKNKVFQIKAKASSGGRLFGSVDKDEVLQVIMKKMKIADNSSISLDIVLSQPLRELGKYPLELVISCPTKTSTTDIVVNLIGE